MTKEEIRKFLDNTKVYVNGKSREIQEKLFSFGYRWSVTCCCTVCNTGEPFLFIHKNGCIKYENNMNFFSDHKNREISAEEILSLEATEPSYRPFRDNKECWNEMQKHQPFGWIKNKKNGDFYCIGEVSWLDEFETVYIALSTSESLSRCSGVVFDEYTFADGMPFGIKED